MEEGVVEVPVGVCSPTQDIPSMCDPLMQENQRLCHTNQIDCLVCCKKGVHSKVPLSHVDCKNRLYRHIQAHKGSAMFEAQRQQRMRGERS